MNLIDADTRMICKSCRTEFPVNDDEFDACCDHPKLEISWPISDTEVLTVTQSDSVS